MLQWGLYPHEGIRFDVLDIITTSETKPVFQVTTEVSNFHKGFYKNYYPLYHVPYWIIKCLYV